MNIAKLIGRERFHRWGGYLIARAMLTPYFPLPGYMDRYWLVPFKPMHGEPEGKDGCYTAKLRSNPFVWMCQKLGVAVRVHYIKRSDTGPYFHDHPASFISTILRGFYFEDSPKFKHGMLDGYVHRFRDTGDVYFRRFDEWHRIEVPHEDIDYGNGDVRDEPVAVFTLVVWFKWRQKWGYLVEPEHKRYYREVHAEAASRLPEIR